MDAGAVVLTITVIATLGIALYLIGSLALSVRRETRRGANRIEKRLSEMESKV